VPWRTFAKWSEQKEKDRLAAASPKSNHVF
jgi:hypothetical protein